MLPVAERSIESAISERGAEPPPFVTAAPAEFVKAGAPASIQTPPGPVTVEPFVSPADVSLTVPVPPAMTTLPMVMASAVCRLMFAAPLPVVTAPEVERVPVELTTVIVPFTAELAAARLMAQLLL
jgi:hypothetical protein